jgi:hypothetical protein
MPLRVPFRLILVLLVVTAFLLSAQIVALLTDWLWYGEVGYRAVFVRLLTAKAILGLLLGSAFFVSLYGNLYLASRSPATDVLIELEDHLGLPSRFIVEPLVRRFLLPGVLVLSVFAGLQAATQWDTFLRFRYRTTFGITDPLFEKDVGFYVFTLPFLNTLYGWVMVLLGVTALLTVLTYLLFRGIQLTSRGPRLSRWARGHLLLLGAALLTVKAAGFQLDLYELLFSPRGVVFGASYADVHAVRPALMLLIVLSLVCAALCVVHLYRPGIRWLATGLIALVAATVVGQGVYPALLQRIRVVPNEIAVETPYILHNIRLTRLAYGLDKVREVEFPAEETLRWEDLQRNRLTIDNIRLWDHRPLLATYGQLQEIRTYYKFVDVDNDRYVIDGRYQQTMLSPRELSYDHLPNRNWINEHFAFTHGYGIVMGPVARISREGLPEFYIQDIPPASTGPLKVTRPEIYYGELSNEYIFVKTTAKEVDYPAGEDNAYTTYAGSGGIPIGPVWRRALFAARFGTIRIPLNENLQRESRILMHRRIDDRVRKIAPFLRFETDPYLVLTKDGRLIWLIDAYTATDHFPYSEPTPRIGNYIRNAVKVTVDAYHGTVHFYVSEPGDPLIQAYGAAFPGLLQPLSAMPEELRAHLRYPTGLFGIQARMYATYHMQNPQVFYNKEDVWNIPRRGGEAREVPMEPYYTIMRLPGEPKEEYILLIPFTPARRDNMSAWLAARADAPHYGTLIVYTFPKQKLVYGPKQIDARINQDAYISQQLALWNQQGSQVIRGSLLAIPVETSLLYVQPLYLAASERGSLPELKRVIAAFGSQIAMEETLEGSLARLFGGPGRGPAVAAARPSAPGAPPMDRAPGVPAGLRELTARAAEQFARAQEMLRQGNWAAYGEQMRGLEQTLKSLRDQAGR